MVRPAMPKIFYTHPAIGRAAERRGDADWVAAQLVHPDMRLLPVWRGKNLIAGPRSAPRPVCLDGTQTWWQRYSSPPALVGFVDGSPYFAADLTDLQAPQADPAIAGIGTFVDLRTCGPLLPAADAALLAHARSITWFHHRHGYCGVCGAPTEPRLAGHARACTTPSCGAEVFPRFDPAVIVLVHDGSRCLLARQPQFPRGLHALLAGFLEPIETLEDCVAREVFEETGVTLTDVRYFASQPWPFPQSLMLGFVARAVDTEITVDPVELESAAWYEPEFLRAHRQARIGKDDFALPRHDSIARLMLDAWLDGML